MVSEMQRQLRRTLARNHSKVRDLFLEPSSNLPGSFD